MTNIVDRRNDHGDESVANRRKFMDRHKKQIQKSIKGTISDIDLKDMGSDEIEVSIEGDLTEPTFTNKPGTGNKNKVYPGNKEYKTGDKIPRDKDGEGPTGREGTDQGGGQDEFKFKVSSKEFMDMFFNDLELPNLAKKKMVKMMSKTFKKHGFSKQGSPSSLNIKRTFRYAIGRRVAMEAQLEEELKEAKKKKDKKKIEELEWALNNMVYIDDVDLRFDHIEAVPEVKFNAVMFCLMDVSGSMGEEEKDLAKRFYILLYLFLRHNYTSVEVVFIRHTEVAKEVDEETFFHSRESGGTVMSSGLELVNDIINSRFPLDAWNIYVAQASDGENFGHDMDKYRHLLRANILPKVQYYAYIEVLGSMWSNWLNEYRSTSNSEVWILLREVQREFKQLQLGRLTEYKNIWPVFKRLFKKH